MTRITFFLVKLWSVNLIDTSLFNEATGGLMHGSEVRSHDSYNMVDVVRLL